MLPENKTCCNQLGSKAAREKSRDQNIAMMDNKQNVQHKHKHVQTKADREKGMESQYASLGSRAGREERGCQAAPPKWQTLKTCVRIHLKKGGQMVPSSTAQWPAKAQVPILPAQRKAVPALGVSSAGMLHTEYAQPKPNKPEHAKFARVHQ